MGWIRYGILFMLNFISINVLAARDQSIGGVAHSLMGPISGVIHIVRGIAVIAGVSLLLGSFVKYSDYRRNPIETGIGIPIAMFFAGVALIILALIPMLVGGNA